MQLYDNKYSFIKDLGNGGFGKVFLAKEKVSHRYVAIKKLLNTNKSDQEDIIHEIEIVSKFENPNIVSYYHHFYEEDILYLVMEFCSGGTLRDKISNNKVTTAEAIEWIQTLATCLRVIHKRGIVHHDIKPDNIAVCQIDGEFTVKRIKIEENIVWLIAENEDYKPIKITPENDFMIWGIVTNSIKTF